MKLREIGEFQLIERMASIFTGAGAAAGDASAAFSRLAIGIGDDTAVWRDSSGHYTLATTDAMVEGVHFTSATIDWYDLGWKAMASNISDIAGMGGIPRYALSVLGASGEQEVDYLLDLCRGMADLAGRFGTRVVGGDTVSSPVTMVTITVLGETASTQVGEGPLPVLSRFTARPEDAIAVTNRLGSSAGGLQLLLRDSGLVPGVYAPLVDAHRRPMPRVREGQLMVEAGVRCGMDLSDGLIGDLTRICRASKVSAVVETDRIPIDPLLTDAFGEGAADLALSGGEDYELLCVASPDTIARARLLLHSAGCALTVVGRVLQEERGLPPVMLMDSEGRTHLPKRRGWEHFSGDGEARGG